MEAFNNNFFLSLLGDVSAVVSSGSSRSLPKHKASIASLMNMIELVRQHRSLTHQYLFHKQDVTNEIEQLDQSIVKAATELCSDRYVGNSIERISLRNKLFQLTSSYKSRSVSTNLVAHGKMIRQLIFQIDSQMVISLDKANKLELTGDYNDQWQTVMSGIEALTQYRLCIMSMNMGLKPEMLAKQASLLHVKLEKIDAVLDEYHSDLNDCIDELSRYLSVKEPSEEYQQALFVLCSKISPVLIDIYQKVVERTFSKAINGGYAA